MEIGIEIGRAYIHIWGGRLYSLNARGRSCRISGEVRSVRPPLGEREEIWVGEGEVRRVSAYYTILSAEVGNFRRYSGTPSLRWF
jgi:hypothetical protein